jgi:hypothetical protein
MIEAPEQGQQRTSTTVRFPLETARVRDTPTSSPYILECRFLVKLPGARNLAYPQSAMSASLTRAGDHARRLDPLRLLDEIRAVHSVEQTVVVERT